MSVAFRRESDDEHLEPKFERPIPPGPNLVTARGLAMIVSQVSALEARIENAVATDREHLARDLRYWRSRLATAQQPSLMRDGEIGFGSRVTFRQDGQVRTIMIVGSDEADPENGRIGFMAPLARALVGGVQGDRMAFQGCDDAIEILHVE